MAIPNSSTRMTITQGILQNFAYLLNLENNTPFLG